MIDFERIKQDTDLPTGGAVDLVITELGVVEAAT